MRIAARLITWNPPLSVRIVPLQPMKRCRPPIRRTVSTPGRSERWYVFANRMSAPAAVRSSGASVFTDPTVPTGMNAGVSTSPWAVRILPARAAVVVSVFSSVNVKAIRASAPLESVLAGRKVR